MELQKSQWRDWIYFRCDFLPLFKNSITISNRYSKRKLSYCTVNTTGRLSTGLYLLSMKNIFKARNSNSNLQVVERAQVLSSQLRRPSRSVVESTLHWGKREGSTSSNWSTIEINETENVISLRQSLNAIGNLSSLLSPWHSNPH